MDIRDVKMAKKVGDVVLEEGNKNKFNVKYLSSISRDELRDSCARVYFFVQDGIIKKIGKSSSSGGIRSTMGPYITGGAGSPGASRFIIHLLLEEALENGSKVELYMITSPKVLAKVNGLFGSKDMEIAGSDEMEDLCMSEYFSKEGKYPDWNFQEKNKSYPTTLALKHALYQEKRIRKKRSKSLEIQK
jgi:hypothetical protein